MSILGWMVMNWWGWRVDGIRMSEAGMSTRLLVILYNMVTLALARRWARLSHCNFCSMAVTAVVGKKS